MENLKKFIERNKNTYKKHADVSKETIEKYQVMFDGKFPKEIIWIWENMGFGVYEDGYLQIVNPEDFDFAFNYIDQYLTPAVIWGMTALGDLLIWEGSKNWTINPDEGNRWVFVNVRKLKREVMGSRVDVYFNIMVNDKGCLLEDYNAKPYLEVKGKLPPLEYGQCYAYVPMLAMGGKALSKNLQVLNAYVHIDIIGQTVGKIIDFS